MENLGAVVSKVMRLKAAEQELFAEVAAFYAPGECGAQIGAGIDREIDAVLAAAGLDRIRYNDLVTERTSARAAFFGGWLLTIGGR